MHESRQVVEPSIQEIHFAFYRFGFYKKLLDDPAMVLARRLIGAFAESSRAMEELIADYMELLAIVVTYGEQRREPVVGDAWQNYILDQLLSDENGFTEKAQYGQQAMGSSMQAAAAQELRAWQQLVHCSAGFWRRQAEAIYGGPLPEWSTVQPILAADRQGAHGDGTAQDPASARQAIKQQLLGSMDWALELPAVIAYHQQYGIGPFARFLAFRWEGKLVGIDYPDPTRLEQLVSYERQRQDVVENTARMIRGYRTNNLLLYGDRGTGKSSTVKSLIHRFGTQGLRLIEVPKSRLGDFPQLIAMLKDRPQKFIIFVDDLSFEEGEDSYKDLKAVLDGGVAARPANVAIYATSNRRHLIKETFADRQQIVQDGEIHPGDTYQEKMSLADRFGITITFLMPNQETYLKIVEILARQSGIAIAREQLHQLALQWAIRHNGRSGRTARQFIDQLIAETGTVRSEG
ncbi:ATP-binding protein [Heliophilum fasciatum]|uniref:AAA+ ATPase domain-containing protein n=1 Tax=Heliophilum fasciatum TaxID=35700 RepID=A0A4R2RUY5_9FIRM|nr:ATP-binding protein [Heliophilum fasciatum]MCW2277175.1 putative AAA+ superfamily ATPase [Heliophilum fasciatum]TCP68190.1 hypothetical protein EDD73_10493 [Heliophilum fasciatum]